jgi:hypothetical protein
MNDYTCPMVSTLGILEPMNPMQPQPNAYIGPLVASDWNMPTVDMGYNYQVSEPVHGGVRHLQGEPEAMRVFDAVNFLFPV